MNWKAVIVVIVLILVLAVGAFLIWIPEKGIELDIKTINTHLQNDTLYMKIEMDNDALTVFRDITSYIHVTVHMDTLQLADVEIEREKSDSEPHNIEIPGAVPVQNVLDLFESESDSVWLRMHIEVGEDLPILGHREFDVDQDSRIVKPRPPGYNLQEIEDFSLKKDSVHFIPKGYLINPNPVAITVRNANLTANIDERFESEVILDPELEVPPNDSVLVETYIGIQDFQLVKDGLAVVFGTDPLPYTVTGTMIVELEDMEILAPIEMEIYHTGEIAISPFAE